jgi:uncharacterized repeat protein (TIGR02543 family)
MDKPGDPEKRGAAFKGWFDAANDGTLHSWPYTVTTDVTMYAQWRDNTQPPPERYTIIFESHGGSVVQAVTADTGTQVSEPAAPYRNGYTFDGWFDAASSGAAYTWPHTLNAAVTMHAQWTPVPYTITYNLDGGTNDPGNPASYTIESEAITLADAARTSYTFAGWYDNSEFTGGAVSSIPQGSTGNKTLYAKWTPVTYTITYYLNDGANNTGNPASYTIESETITLAAAARDHYNFAGWYDDSEFNGGAVTEIPQGSTGEVTLYAKWTPVDYPITYHLYEGTNNPGNPASYTIESAAITLADPTRGGFDFAGWYDNSGFSGQKISSIPKGSTGAKTFYAQWWPDVSVVLVWVNEDGSILDISNDDITISKSASGYDASFTATVEDAYSGVRWYLNDEPIDGSRGTAQSITVKAADYGNGEYHLGVTVTKDSVPYSTDIHFTVVN